MAKTILTDVKITVNAVDLTDHISSVEIQESSDDVDLSAFGSRTKVHGVGMSDASMTFNFYQDFSGASVDAVLSPIYAAGTAVPVVVTPTSAAVSATNPKRTMQGLLMNYTSLSGKVGDASQTSVKFTNGDPSGIVRATS